MNPQRRIGKKSRPVTSLYSLNIIFFSFVSFFFFAVPLSLIKITCICGQTCSYCHLYLHLNKVLCVYILISGKILKAYGSLSLYMYISNNFTIIYNNVTYTLLLLVVVVGRAKNLDFFFCFNLTCSCSNINHTFNV